MTRDDALMTACPPEYDAVILRLCAADMTSHGGYVWPRHGLATAPDWSPIVECGHGLHGWLHGEGDHRSAIMWGRQDAMWVVARVVASEVVDLGGKVKVPRAWVVMCGTQAEATAEVYRLCGMRAVIGGMSAAGHYGTATAGDHGTATAGHYGTATAGDYGTATAGYRGTTTAGDGGMSAAGHYGTATAGDYGTATAGDHGTATAGDGCMSAAGDYGTATAGDDGTATAGDDGTATAGDYGTATAGHYGTATAGDYGTATAGDYGTATAGDYGTATAGDGGTATAGYRGSLRVAWWDVDAQRHRTAVGYVGEDGVEAGVVYRCEGGRFVRVEVGQ